jgi:cell division protein FtsB
MMAGVKTANRARYTSAGYVRREERELYIARAQAGSAQDNLRDLNRVGYRSERPWNEAPQPVFESAAEVVQAPVKRRTKKQRGFWDRLEYHAKRDKKGVMMCVALLFAMLMMLAVWGGEMVDGVVLTRDIQAYQSQTRYIQMENEKLQRQLELASSGERIRNMAQNELGMLRPERANHETIYIRTTDYAAQQVQTQSGGVQMELLDILLGLLNVFHIGE